MSTTYSANIKLGEPGIGDTGWGAVLNSNAGILDALNPVGDLAVTTHEQPSGSLLVDVAAGNFVKPDRTVGTYAGVSGQAIPTGTTKALYLDGTNAWALTLGASYPTTPHVRLGTVVAGASTITSITDDRQAFGAVGSNVTSDTDGATFSFDLSLGLYHQVTLGGNRTLALSNPQVGDRFAIVLKQDGTGSRTVTWFSGILWPGGSAPTLTTTAAKSDAFEFLCISSGVYLNLTKSQNL
jgi:hypothetical protein